MFKMSILGSPLNYEPGALPLQRQLIQRLKHAIFEGQLAAGAKLPSSRALAEELNISRNTVLVAYEQLSAEGYIVADRQSTRVAQLSSYSRAAQTIEGETTERVFSAEHLTHIVPSSCLYGDRVQPLTPGLPALNQFPIHLWRRALDTALHASLPAVLSYGDPLGEPALRQAIAQHLGVSRGVRCDASQIVMTEGAQEALSLCVRLFTHPGDTVWLEDPGYRGARTAFYAGDLNLVPMRVDQDGIVVPSQAWLRDAPRLIQTTPSHQYPKGAVLSLTRRIDLIEQASRTGAWIIEDDYDSEFRHQGEPIAAMQGLFPEAPVLYIGTFSKTMFPALRLGFLILPKPIAARLTPLIGELLRGGHRLEQLAMAAFIESGQFARHLGRMRRLYRERQTALREALSAYFDVEHEVLGGNSGLHLTVRLPEELSDQAIMKKARLGGMNPGALSAFAIAPQPDDNGLVIGYGNTSAERFAPLIKQLSRIARSLHD